jgi:hypothetical protein
MATMDQLLSAKLSKLGYHVRILTQGQLPKHNVGDKSYQPPEAMVQVDFDKSPTPEEVATKLLKFIVDLVSHVEASARTVHVTFRPIDLEALDDSGVMAYTHVSVLAL